MSKQVGAKQITAPFRSTFPWRDAHESIKKYQKRFTVCSKNPEIQLRYEFDESGKPMGLCERCPHCKKFHNPARAAFDPNQNDALTSLTYHWEIWEDDHHVPTTEPPKPDEIKPEPGKLIQIEIKQIQFGLGKPTIYIDREGRRYVSEHEFLQGANTTIGAKRFKLVKWYDAVQWGLKRPGKEFKITFKDGSPTENCHFTNDHGDFTLTPKWVRDGEWWIESEGK